MNHQPYTLKQLFAYFLKLGATGFGGPVALVNYMHVDLVEERKWIHEDEYKQGLTLAQLAPGPLAAQLSFYIGFVHYGFLGAVLIGLGFILPSFLIVVLLGVLYKYFEGLAWIQSAFYAVGASVTSIMLISAYKLIQKTLGKFNSQSFRQNKLLWFTFTITFFTTLFSKSENILLFIVLGFSYAFIKNTKKQYKLGSFIFFIFQIQTAQITSNESLKQIGLFFLKAGAFVFGSGLVIVPFLHSGVVAENHWLTEQEFLDSIAVAMLTPGPVVITVGFIGYLVHGFSGALVATIATFLPCFLLTVLPAPYFKKITSNTSIKFFVDGITAAIVGSLLAAVIIIAKKTITDIPTIVICLTSVLSLRYLKKLKEPIIIVSAAIIGILIKLLL